MEDLNNVRMGKDENFFTSGFAWLSTSVFIVIAPLFLTWLFKSISEERIISIRCYCTDILLILFSISCSVLTLYIDRDKLIKKNKRKFGIVISIILAILSGCLYFYLTGAEKSLNNILFYIIIGLCVIYCARKGYKTVNEHTSYLSTENQELNNNTIRN